MPQAVTLDVPVELIKAPAGASGAVDQSFLGATIVPQWQDPRAWTVEDISLWLRWLGIGLAFAIRSLVLAKTGEDTKPCKK